MRNDEGRSKKFVINFLVRRHENSLVVRVRNPSTLFKCQPELFRFLSCQFEKIEAPKRNVASDVLSKLKETTINMPSIKFSCFCLPKFTWEQHKKRKEKKSAHVKAFNFAICVVNTQINFDVFQKIFHTDNAKLNLRDTTSSDNDGKQHRKLIDFYFNTKFLSSH